MSLRRTALIFGLLAAGLSMLSGCGQTFQSAKLHVTQLYLPNVVAGNPYSQTLTGTNGVQPYTFSFVGGTLPPGLTFTAGTNQAVIAGTPTTVGSYTFTIGIKDSSGMSNIAIFTVGASGLSGQYFWYEQYYYSDYGSDVKKASSTKPHGWPSAAMKRAAMQHPLHHAAPKLTSRISKMKGMHALPDQGSFYSDIEWGSVAGSFTTDGSGNITGGEYDVNSSYGSYTSTISGGSYQLNPDSTGTASIVLDDGAVISYYLGAHNLNATTQINQTIAITEATTDGETYIEYGDGQFLEQTPSAITAPLSGNWIQSFRGETCYYCEQEAVGDLLGAGLFNFDGDGDITNASNFDVTTEYDTDSSVDPYGSIGITPDSFGRTTATVDNTNYGDGDGYLPTNYAIYSIDATHAYLISLDQESDSYPPYIYGPMDQQSNLTFTNSTLVGNYAIWGNSEDYENETYPDTTSDVQISLLAADGAGDLSGTGDFNYTGSVYSGVITQGTYATSSQGRVQFYNNFDDSGVTLPKSFHGNKAKAARLKTRSKQDTYYNAADYVLWMIDATHGFGLQQTYDDYEPSTMTFGQQASGTFSNSSVSGAYGVGSEYTATSASLVVAGTASADGNGNLTGVLGGADPYGTGYGTANATYTVAGNGRGTATGGTDSFIGTSVFYVINSGQVITMDTTSTDPAPGLTDLNQ